MPRSRRRRPEARPLTMRGVHGAATRVQWAGRSWLVRRLSGQTSERTYRCPGCHHDIAPGTAHVVAWPEDGLGGGGGVEDRRHWHSACWRARDHRG